MAYDRYRKNLPADASCIFCEIKAGDNQFITETEHFKLIYNTFPYSYWDNNKVDEHLMIVPKQHTDTLKDLSFIESREYIEQISKYENLGYNIYARTPGSNTKSIIHQHTHLIKSIPKPKKTLGLKAKLRFKK